MAIFDEVLAAEVKDAVKSVVSSVAVGIAAHDGERIQGIFTTIDEQFADDPESVLLMFKTTLMIAAFGIVRDVENNNI